MDKLTSLVDDSPKLQKSPEEIQQLEERTKVVEKEQKYSVTLRKTNDVLDKVNLSDNEEDFLRKILVKQDNKTLENLAKKSEDEILTFCFQAQNNETTLKKESSKNTEIKETQKQNIENKEIDKQILKIQSIFTHEILNHNVDIAENLFALNTAKTPQEKDNILKGILNILKEPWKLESILGAIWWADKNNPQYLELKNTLISLDPSLKPTFEKLEFINESLNTKEITNEINKESWWTLDIDLRANPPVSKLSLETNWYSFNEDLDKQALDDVMTTTTDKLNDINETFGALNEFWTSFDNLKSEVWKIWNQDNFKTNLKAIVDNFSTEVFENLKNSYKTMNIPTHLQIDEFEIESFNDIESPDELKTKIENLEKKLAQIKNYVQESKNETLATYKQDIKELLQKDPQEKEKQLKILKFLDNTWFSIFPQHLTDKIIKNIQANVLIIPWLDLSSKNIDLANWNFWESSMFANNENWLNNMAKTNLVKFVNKMISWDINEPLNVKAIVNGTTVINPATLKANLEKNDIVSSVAWHYGTIVDNLRNSSQNQSY